MAQPANQAGQKQDNRQLCNLRRLNGNAENPQPPFCPVCLIAERNNQENQPDGHRNAHHGKALPEMIGNIGNHYHRRYAESRGSYLPSQEIRGIPLIVQACVVGAGRVEHHQPESKQKKYDEKQGIVKKRLLRFPFSSSLTVSKSSYRHNH